MGHDRVVFYLVVTLIVLFLFFRFKRSNLLGKSNGYPFEITKKYESNEITRLLETNHYEILTSKKSFPIRMRIDQEELRSRYFVDYFVRKDEKWFLVKVENQRRPFDWTGSSVRNHLLPYLLHFPNAAGLIVVRLQWKDLKIITFEND